MSEYLLGEESSDNIFEESSAIKEQSSHKGDFEIDIIEETLKHIYSKSNIRKKLSYILAVFYKYPILIIIISFILGFIFFGLPLFLLYLKVYKNFFVPFCIILIISLILCLLNMLIRIVDDKKNKINMMAKWERNNLINHLGLLLTIILLFAGVCLEVNFFINIKDYNENEELKLIYEPLDDKIKDDKYKKINEFFLNFIINCILLFF